MKLLFLMLISFCFFSCQHNPFSDAKLSVEKHISTAEDWAKASNDYPRDTTIHQDIWYNERFGYCLQTWVQTRNQQTHFSKYADFQMFIDTDTYSPYNVDVSETFDYIKQVKIPEYNKAKHFVDSIKLATLSLRIIQKADSIRNKKINDSINLLTSIKP